MGSQLLTTAEAQHNTGDAHAYAGWEKIGLELQRQLILSELQQGDPETSNAYASHCAGVINSDLVYALCLARIHKDAGLLQQALEQLDALLGDALRPFCEAEAVRRIAELRTHSEVVSCA